MPGGVPVAVVLDHALPGVQKLRRAPMSIGESRPRTSHGCSGEPKGGEPRDNGSAALEQATAEEHPEEVDEAQIGAHGHTHHDMRQTVVDTVE
jgi:hypothetical protein